MIPIITIEGATASGKSAVAVALAERFGGEIISADSRQVYRYMDIGTAKATHEEQAIAKHHLIDLINPDESYNAGLFAKDADKMIRDLNDRKATPIVCGGTGLYIRSLLYGLCEIPSIPSSIRNELRLRLLSEDVATLFNELKTLDPTFASSISHNDTQRILRGLEVVIGTGKTLTEYWQSQQQKNCFKTLRIFLNPPRNILYRRINDRIQEMLKIGLLDEIKSLLEMGYSNKSAGLCTMGYKEFFPYLDGKVNLEECSELVAQHHRNYAKRQLTWYRKCRFDLTFDPEEVKLSEIIKRVEVSFQRQNDANCRQSI